MQSNRIHNVQRRAKRKILALAIVATAFAGNCAVSTFGQELKTQQLPIEKMSRVPGVKAVGIRLIPSNGKQLPTPVANANAAPLAFPSTVPSAMPSTLPAAGLLLPAAFPTADSEPASSPTYVSLPAMPKKPDLKSNQPTGKVLMKLNGGEGNAEPPVMAPSAPQATAEMQMLPASEPAAPTETVNVRVIPSRSISPPAKMPPFLVEPTGRKADASSDAAKDASQGFATTALPSQSTSQSTSTAASQTTAVRMSLGDSLVDSNETATVPPTKNRVPQLVKFKPTKLEHTVSLALSTEIESRKVYDEPETDGQTVEVDTSLVPHSISAGGGATSSKGMVPKAVVSDTVPDAFVAIAPPSRELQMEPPLRNPKPTSAAMEPSNDLTRRRFDSRPTYQSPVATVDLESLAATTMNLAGRFVAIAVQDESVCKVLHNDRAISLVGNQVGSTLVQIWTADLGDTPQVIQVNVTQPGGKVQATTNAVKDIKQVIAQSFPRAEVSILGKEDGSLEVKGTTDSEESARRILELVRKIYLVPVKDKLTVSN